MIDLLIKLNACQEAQEWAADKTCQELYDTCDRGDWLLWLFSRTNPNDLQLLTLAKGHIANAARHLMKDDRSVKAVDVAIAFGEGRATREELDSAAASADIAASAASASVAASVADIASSAAAVAAATAYTAYAAYAASYTCAAAEKMSLKQSADIVRKYIPIELWNVNN